jgi:hypothetical protein
MKKLFGYLLIIALFGTVWSANASNAKIVGHTYVNSRYGFQISLPNDLTGWNIGTGEETEWNLGIEIFGLITGPSQAVINMSVEWIPYSFLESYIKETKTSYELYVKDWKEESERLITIGETKIQGYELVGTFSGSNGEGYKLILWIIKRGSYGYGIAGRDISENFDIETFRKIMSTFEFIPFGVSQKKSAAATWGSIKTQ